MAGGRSDDRGDTTSPLPSSVRKPTAGAVRATLLGTAQDGGRPQAGCTDACCSAAASDPELWRSPVSLGVTSPRGGTHLIDATRDLARQLAIWSSADPSFTGAEAMDAVWLTHLHLGHVDGLGQFGREAMASDGLPVRGSASVIAAVRSNPLWSTAIEAGHLVPLPFEDDRAEPQPDFSIEPIPVPHRAEVSDTHAYVIRGANGSLLHLPDHDSWAETLALHGAATIREWLDGLSIDVALIDATFWSLEEIAHREPAEVPHPTVEETLQRLGPRRDGDPRIVMIHLNHTNPLHEPTSPEGREVTGQGWEIGREGTVFDL